MNVSSQFGRYLALLCLAAAPFPALAQRANTKSAAAASGGYSVANDVSLGGTILSYTENSKTAPLGTRVQLQTAAGNVDVHLGDARVPRQGRRQECFRQSAGGGAMKTAALARLANPFLKQFALLATFCCAIWAA